MDKKLLNASMKFNLACLDKLAEKEKDGKDGWDNPENEPHLRFQLLQHFEKDWTQDNLVDISNYCMFLWNLEEKKK